jgi:hypothetical protein
VAGRGEEVSVVQGRAPRRDRILGILALSLLGAAVIQELRKPGDERTWVGKVAGIFPYDLRRPTLQRLTASVWSPDDRRILMPHAFGVGWTVNVGRLVRLVRGAPAAEVAAGGR